MMFAPAFIHSSATTALRVSMLIVVWFFAKSIIGKSFNGYDYNTSSYFSGSVNNESISLYDYETSTYSNYSI